MRLRSRALFWAMFSLCAALSALAQSDLPQTVPESLALPVSERPVIDGRLDEDAWKKAPPVSGFRQRDPDEGRPATEQTTLRFLYDTHNLYVGVELSDSQPAGIVARSSRRDDFQDSDYFQLYLDPYHDHLTGVLLQVSAAGSQRDFVISNDTNLDSSWDGVWESAVRITETGWFLEMRIPFSQLRFGPSAHYTWGINAARYIQRRNETSWLQLVPKNEFGQASRMAHLSGIEDIEHGHSIEVLPYVRTGVELGPAQPGNPFNDGTRVQGGSGVDFKYGLSSNLTLNGTVNPDFGQVEVDPAVVNLSAFETFFQEKRPFFVEGQQIFNSFGRGAGGGGGVVFPNYFYSRRIGRSPQGSASGDFVDRPGAATILGAAKITGKTRSGWTLGFIDATTSPEHARVATGQEISKVQIEPLANYFVGRVLKEKGGRWGFGTLVTGVERNLETTALQDIMARRAHVVGGDGYYYFDKNRVWSVTGRISASKISGSANDIARLQRAPQRYFQRPDAVRVRLDTTRTSLSGWAGGMNFGKNAGGVLLGASISGNSPGFDANDAGFQTNSDLWGTTANLNWRQLHPDRVSRNRNISIFRFDSFNFDRQRKNTFTDINGNVTFLNYWNVFGDMSFNQAALDDRLTRGGPLTASAADRNFFLGVGSDGRKRVNFGLNSGYSYNSYGYWSSNTNLNVGLKPLSSITLTVGPEFDRAHLFVQYVSAIDDPTAVQTFGKRYVFADLDQSSAALTSRVNLSMSPTVSLQVFSQMLLSVGDYWGFKELEKPRTLSFLKYGQNIGTIGRSSDGYVVDPDGSGPATPFTISDPNFNFKSLRLNAVFRWEWKRGSTLYLVWTQSRTDDQFPGALSAGRDLRSLFGAPSHNVFLIKTSYWFNR